MGKPLRVLLVEDSERDAALLLLYLRRSGYDATVHRVETAQEMKANLDSSQWDVVISDFNLPRFNAHAALKLLKENGHRVPFIVVSGEAAEDVVNGILQAGANRYLGKDEMSKVVQAIEQEMARE